MAEYIEREAAVNAIIAIMPSMSTPDGHGERDDLVLAAQEMCEDNIREINNIPAADIAPARAVVASAPTADVTSVEWIRADERLPDDERDGETVLAIVSGKPHENITLCQAIMLAGYFGEEGWLVNEYPEWENPVVTHWMPLPELPKNK